MYPNCLNYLKCGTKQLKVFRSCLTQVALLLFFVTMVLPTQGQGVIVTGNFGTDSIKIGQPVPYFLSAHYPQQNSIVFPDSTFAFSPFEFQQKVFFPTHTKDGISTDSVIYYLSTFEVDSIQRLSLPVFVIQKKDCTAVMANQDSVFVLQMVKHVPDSVTTEKLTLKTNTAYQQVSWLFNYPVMIVIAGVLTVLALLTWIIFGKRIRKYYRLKKLNRSHRQFTERYGQAVGRLKENFSPSQAESVVVLWKNYMEGLLAKPYPKLTSREIFVTEKDEKLGQSLRNIDRTIYGGEPSFAEEPFTNLRDYTEQQFRKKIEEVQYG